MPKSAILPLAFIRNVYIQIHPAIDTADRPISKIRAECFAAVNSGLPAYQQVYNLHTNTYTNRYTTYILTRIPAGIPITY